MATYCTRCGSEVPDGTTLCAKCREITLVGTPHRFAAGEHTSDVDAVTSTSDTVSPTLQADRKRIGGWLLLPAFGLAVGPLLTLRGIYSDLHVLYGSHFQARLAARPGIAFLILFEATTNGIMLMALIGLNVLFYRTRRTFPRWMITYLIAAFFLTFIDHVLTLHYHPSVEWTAVFQRSIGALIWVPYFMQARRVKQTFLN